MATLADRMADYPEVFKAEVDRMTLDDKLAFLRRLTILMAARLSEREWRNCLDSAMKDAVK